MKKFSNLLSILLLLILFSFSNCSNKLLISNTITDMKNVGYPIQNNSKTIIVFVSEIYCEPCFKAVANCIKENSFNQDSINILIIVNSHFVKNNFEKRFLLNKMDELFDYKHLVVFDESVNIFKKFKIKNTPAILIINPTKNYSVLFKYEDLFEDGVNFLKFKLKVLSELNCL